MRNEQVTNRELKELRQLAFELRKKEPAYKRAANIDLLITFLGAILVALSIQGFLLEFTRVEGPSMEPTLFTDERMFVEKLSYGWSEPQRGDVVIVHYPNRADTCVKRVIGLPGEEVSIRGGVTYINGEPLDESQWWGGIMFSETDPVVVPPRSVFVMGDNRNFSSDSRDVGVIPYSHFVGRVQGILWPLSRFTIGIPYPNRG